MSEDTFLYRTDQLLGGGVIDPARLIGDLNLRRARGPRLADVRATISRATARITGAAQPEPQRAAALLALDWSGAQSEMLIGRHRDCDVVLSALSVSRRHARLFFRDGTVDPSRS
jgi:FHA domain